MLGSGGDGTSDNFGLYMTAAGTQLTSVDGDINLTGIGGAGSGADNYGIRVEASADILSTGTSGNAATITLNGTGGTGTSENYGVSINSNGTLLSSVDGDITITGTGGGSGAGSDNVGFYTASKAVISSTGTDENAAKITITGVGGTGINNQRGFYITSADTEITSAYGNIYLAGTGGNSTGANTQGLLVNSASQVNSTGTGANAATITLVGVGGAGGSSGKRGIYVNGANSEINSVHGDITLTGTGGDGANGSQMGVTIYNGGEVNSTGTGENAASITITGVGGAGTNSNYGIQIALAGTQVTSIDGDVSLAGTANGTGTNKWGFHVSDDASVIVTGGGDLSIWGKGAGGDSDISTLTGTNIFGDVGMTGNITLIGDDYSLADFTIDTLGTLTLSNRTAGTTMGVGTGAGDVQFTDALLGDMTAGGYVFGSDSAGTIDFNSAFNFGAASIGLLSSQDVLVNADISTTYAGETGIEIVVGRSLKINSGNDALSAPNSRWLVYGVSAQHNEMDGITADFSRYSCRYGTDTCSTVPATGNGFLYRQTPRLTVIPQSIEITEGDALPTIPYTISGWLGDDKAADSISGSALYSGDVSGAAGSNFATQKIESTLASALGYGFTFLDSTGSILQGAVEEVITPPTLPTTPVMPETPSTPITPPTPDFEVFYGGELITGYSSLPETIQQEVAFSYLDNLEHDRAVERLEQNKFDTIISDDMSTNTPFLILPSNLTISNEALKRYRLKAQ